MALGHVFARADPSGKWRALTRITMADGVRVELEHVPEKPVAFSDENMLRPIEMAQCLVDWIESIQSENALAAIMPRTPKP